jgi:cytochrome c553
MQKVERALRIAVLFSAAWIPGASLADDPAMERARKIVSGRCFLCHGVQGEAASELSPRLAGQNAQYVAKQLANIKSGERRSSAMRPMVSDLSPDDMRALGLYFSQQHVGGHVSDDARLVAEGKAIFERGGAAGAALACVNCHGAKAHGSDSLPRLAGQVATYLVAQLKNFGARERTNDNAVMHDVAAGLNEQEIRAVAEYLSTLD